MSLSNAIQKAIYELLIADAAVSAIVGARVSDNPLSTEAFPSISFGPSDVVFDEALCADGRVETVQLDLWSNAQDGKKEVKALCDAVKAALHDAEPDLETGSMVAMRVTAVRVLDDPAGGHHGIVTVECTAEV